MSTRGGVHTFFPKYTEAGPDGVRVLKESPQAAYRFWFRGVRYVGAGYKNKKAALDAGEKRKAELKAGLEQDPTKYTLGALHQLAEAHAGELAESTQESHKNTWRRLLKFFPPAMPLVSVDDVALHQYLKHKRKEGASDNTTRLDLSWLKKAMRIAQRKRLLVWLPAFPAIKYVRREEVFAPGELEKILSHMPNSYRLLFRAAEATAWRTRSELTTRKWTDVLEDRIVVDAESTKSGKARPFPMTKRLRAVLDEARAHVDAVQKRTGQVIPWVFCRDDGSRFATFGDMWRGALERAGYKPIPGKEGKPWSSPRLPHDIRRTELRKWHRGVRLEADARLALAGHGEQAHKLYLDQGPDDELLKAAAEQLDRFDGAAEPAKVVSGEFGKKGG